MKTPYLCNRYPEYNLFTLKKLVPIENDVALCEESGIFLFHFNCDFVELFYTSFVQCF